MICLSHFLVTKLAELFQWHMNCTYIFLILWTLECLFIPLQLGSYSALRVSKSELAAAALKSVLKEFIKNWNSHLYSSFSENLSIALCTWKCIIHCLKHCGKQFNIFSVAHKITLWDAKWKLEKLNEWRCLLQNLLYKKELPHSMLK